MRGMMLDGDVKGPVLAPLAALARSAVTVFAPVQAALPRVCVYENVHEYNQFFAQHLLGDIYAPRHAAFGAVELVTLPPGAVVHGDCHYLTQSGETFVQEQYHEFWHAAGVPRALAGTTPAEHVPGEVVLLARLGVDTWGHWLGELLPRAVVAEFTAPGRYRFAVPEHFRTHASPNFLASLRAYGIGEDRLVFIHPERRYVFERLASVTSMWIYPYAMHPAALALLRLALKEPVPAAPPGAEEAVMLRQEQHGQQIINHAEVLGHLRQRGFTVFDVGALPFIEQVALFRAAGTVFGQLGSSLTGLLYSPYGVRAVSAAPGDWGDCFFHGILQGQHGIYADLRGTPEAPGEQLMYAPFTLATAKLDEALAAIGV